MAGTGTADLAGKTLQFRVEPKLVLSLEGQGGAADPVGIGVPVVVQGPWGAPRIYPEVAGILENPEAAYAKLRERTSLKAFLWGFLDNGPVQNRHKTMSDIPAETETSKRISKALKAEGFRFVGPTTMYAFMQSAGMVNDHLVSCHRYAPCAKLQLAKVKP